MILDERNEFADATALSTAATGLALVGDVIDLGTDGINEVDGIDLAITIDTAVTSAGAATVEFQLVSTPRQPSLSTAAPPCTTSPPPCPRPPWSPATTW